MFFGVLGPVAMWTADGEPVPVPGLKVRALLAVLLVREGRPVPAARLIDALWGEHVPGDPAGTLSGKVTQLRRALERAEPGGRRLVASPPPGYRLRIDADAVDAHRFRTLTARARETDTPGITPAENDRSPLQALTPTGPRGPQTGPLPPCREPTSRTKTTAATPAAS